jgi:hypothetical protein
MRTGEGCRAPCAKSFSVPRGGRFIPFFVCARPAGWCVLAAVLVGPGSLSTRTVPAGAPAAGPAASHVVVAGGAAADATASNNQVKVARITGALVVAYAGLTRGSEQVFLAISRDNGGRWSVLTQVSSGPASSRLPAVAVDGAGRLHVIWTRYDDGVGAIYHRVWAQTWMGPQQKISPGSGYAGYPALALDAAGDPQVVWYGIREGPVPTSTRHGSIYEIFYTGFDGHAWSRPLLISPGLPDSINPALAADRGGRLHAAWYQYNGRVYQVRYAERGRAWTAPEGSFRASADEFNPDLAADAQGQVALVWEHHVGERSFIYYARRAGGTWGEPVALTDGASPARHPAVAITSSGIVYVVWDQDNGQVYQRRLAGRWDPVVRLTADGGNTFPNVAAGGVGAVWTHAAPGGAVVEFAPFTP